MTLMPDARVIHLATHGVAYSSDALVRKSFLVVAPTDHDDGMLTVTDILDRLPRLHADLVVLSACETARGEVRQSEGTVGFQRAFLARGARSVLVTLWPIDDEATNVFMQRFYNYWRSGTRGISKTDALRMTSSYMRDSVPRFASARYWAAFQLVGAR